MAKSSRFPKGVSTQPAPYRGLSREDWMRRHDRIFAEYGVSFVHSRALLKEDPTAEEWTNNLDGAKRELKELLRRVVNTRFPRKKRSGKLEQIEQFTSVRECLAELQQLLPSALGQSANPPQHRVGRKTKWTLSAKVVVFYHIIEKCDQLKQDVHTGKNRLTVIDSELRHLRYQYKSDSKRLDRVYRNFRREIDDCLSELKDEYREELMYTDPHNGRTAIENLLLTVGEDLSGGKNQTAAEKLNRLGLRQFIFNVLSACHPAPNVVSA